MVAQVTRILEVTGLTISLISLIVSLFIFTYFRLNTFKKLSSIDELLQTF